MDDGNTTVFRITEDDIEFRLNRPLCPGETVTARKALEYMVADALDGLEMPEPPTTGISAMGVVAGHYVREYGDYDWMLVKQVQQHGDTALFRYTEHISQDDPQGSWHETSYDRDTILELLVWMP